MEIDLRGLDDPAKYDQLVDLDSSMWWDPEGPMAGLHLLNQVRIPYFEEVLGSYRGKRILDVGCGGGIVTEPLVEAGAEVVAIDPSEKSIEAARQRAAERGLDVDYRVTSAESFEASEEFDVVLAVDVLEHVEDLDASLDTCARALGPGGVFGFLTHNQTLEAFEFLVWEGEYQEGFIPKGNHDFHKFIDPEDLDARLAGRGITVEEMRGVDIDIDVEPPRVRFEESLAVTYIGHGRKE